MIPSSVITPIPTGWSQDSESRSGARAQNEQKAANQTAQTDTQTSARASTRASAAAQYIPAIPDDETLEWLASERRGQQQSQKGPAGMYAEVDTIKADDRRGNLLDIFV